jgi:hypothetical protein
VTASKQVLEPLGLQLESHAQDVIPIRDCHWYFAEGSRPQSYHHRMRFKVHNRDPITIRLALEKCLNSRQVFRTVLAKLPDGTPFHVALHPSRELYDLLIVDATVADETAMKALYEDDSAEAFHFPRMFQATIVTAQNPKSISLFIDYNHSVIDTISIYHWYADLERLLQNLDSVISTPTPFKLFAGLVYSHDTSPCAIADVDYFVNRLKGMSKFQRAIWPKQRAPGWLVGTDIGSKYYLARAAIGKEHNITATKIPRVVRVRKCPHLQDLNLKHHIKPAVTVKRAIALFNIQQTGENVAIFENMEIGRD